MTDETITAPTTTRTAPLRAYQKPVLTAFGPLHLQTRGSTGGFLDGGGGRTNEAGSD